MASMTNSYQTAIFIFIKALDDHLHFAFDAIFCALRHHFIGQSSDLLNTSANNV